jgi:hypothetical protein
VDEHDINILWKPKQGSSNRCLAGFTTTDNEDLSTKIFEEQRTHALNSLFWGSDHHKVNVS